MPKTRLLCLAASIAIVAAACSAPGASPSTTPASSTDPSASPSADPTTGSLTYPTGADEIVLRLEEGGGFVPAEFAATNVPWFTLYGDGTVIFRGLEEFPVPPENGGPTIWPALHTAKLAPDQIQALLEFAIAEGGLAVARDKYTNDMIADAGTTTFYINAGGVEKTVEAYALGLDVEPGPDSQVKAALVKLAERLRDFDQQGSLPSAEYIPSAYRGLLWESGGGMVASVPWPWADLTPTDFKADADPTAGMSFPRRTMDPGEVSALGLTDVKGAVSGIQLNGPDGKVYSFVLRPLLPDEAG